MDAATAKPSPTEKIVGWMGWMVRGLRQCRSKADADGEREWMGRGDGWDGWDEWGEEMDEGGWGEEVERMV